MTVPRSAPSAQGRTALVGRTVAGTRPSTLRSVERPMRSTPPLRPSEPPLSPSRRDVLRQWEEADEWSCAYCDAPFGLMVVAEVDHIRPLARGGLHEWSNFAPACTRCNGTKSDRDVLEFLAEIAGEGLTGDDRSAT